MGGFRYPGGFISASYNAAAFNAFTAAAVEYLVVAGGGGGGGYVGAGGGAVFLPRLRSAGCVPHLRNGSRGGTRCDGGECAGGWYALSGAAGSDRGGWPILRGWFCSRVLLQALVGLFDGDLTLAAPSRL